MDIIEPYLPALFFLSATLVLIALSIIDFRTWILPDWLNLTLGLLGIAFHFSVDFIFMPPSGLIFGALTGAGILYVIRLGGNYYYKQDTLGLGDVKLLGAAGLWLGVEGVVMAMTVGAFAGLVHGILVAVIRGIREKSSPNLHRLMIPAGPGFCVGIACVGLWQYAEFVME
ncbi:MAG: prepilin peptidase [Alphaproteobacteria bacterium]|nr:prepilin peptidase [Alphaproteobacteria bacterium]MCB1551663.1 prepilin peptidase [Alphaproteobacteria bacterium]MCB9984241.1 prepilin peptidase [Micavibrio sp.]HPQ51005.1 A24 family peptidase [Alphaproteobacteria bacterium]HRK97085.1 A24 family peptidase [Alphaproteobacteria bacterium]